MQNRKKKVIYSFICFLVAFVEFFVVTTPTFALSDYWERIFKHNKIIFWNPDENKSNDGEDNNRTCEPSTDPGKIPEGDDNASTIIGYLMSHGYSKDGAAAIAGNLYVESGLNPRKLQGGRVVDEDYEMNVNDSVGFGIAQWTSSGRKQGLKNYADENGLKVTSLKAQLGYLLKELTGSYASTSSPSALSSYNLSEATFQIRRYYESPAAMIYTTRNGKYYNDYVPKTLSEVDENKTPGAYGEWKKAYNAAQSLLGITPTDNPLEEECEDTDEDEEYDDISKDDIEEIIKKNGWVFYNQCDPRWKNYNYGKEGINGDDMNSICASGCGPTSFAVIATNLLKKAITPEETADKAGRAGYHIAGSGSGWGITSYLAGQYGLTAQSISKSISTINEYLDKGYMIHTSGKGAAPFTKGGHYIAIVQKLPNGQWLVADSSSRGPSGVYNPQTVLAGMHKNVWAVGK